jgi:protein involved in ribonucleotide reduction
LIVYFSGLSENTKRFVDKLGIPADRIPLRWDSKSPLVVDQDYILIIPTYGSGSDHSSVPKQVVKFLNIEANRLHIKGIVGMGNTNFGPDFCRAANVISKKTGASVLHRVEIFGTEEDVEMVKALIPDYL